MVLSLSIEAKNSDSPLVLVNKRIGEFRFSFSTYSIIESATSEIEPPTNFTSTSYFLTDSSLIILHGFFVPTRNCAASSVFPIVADKPVRIIFWFEFSCNLSKLNDSWEPLSLAKSSCTSSIIIHSSSESAVNIFC